MPLHETDTKEISFKTIIHQNGATFQQLKKLIHRDLAITQTTNMVEKIALKMMLKFKPWSAKTKMGKNNFLLYIVYFNY